MLTLKANNSFLSNNSTFSYLQDNYASGVSSIVAMSVVNFTAFFYALLGEFGSESSEIVYVTGVNTSTRAFTLSANTLFSHSESTKVTIIPYNQVKFYYSATSTFASSALLSTVNVTPDDFFTRYVDNTNSSGYGWFTFYLSKTLGTSTTQFDITKTVSTARYTWDTTGVDPGIISNIFVGYSVVINGQNFNSANNGTFIVTAVGTNYFEITNSAAVIESNVTLGTGTLTVVSETSESNAIPYADFSNNSVKKIIDAFFSQLNNKETSLITRDDAFYWLNEGYAIAVNELNLVNQQFNVPALYTLNVLSGTQEYLLPSNFGKLLGIGDQDGQQIFNISLRKVVTTQLTYSTVSRASDMYYYIRGGYIGFFPSPTQNFTLQLFYASISNTLTSLYDNVVLPQNNYYFILDYMLFRAAPKLGKTDGASRLTLFQNGINRMKVTSLKQDANLDSWSIARESNV